jgi:hypothetical protein
MGCKTLSCLEAAGQFPTLPQGYVASGASWFISGYCPRCSAV